MREPKEHRRFAEALAGTYQADDEFRAGGRLYGELNLPGADEIDTLRRIVAAEQNSAARRVDDGSRPGKMCERSLSALREHRDIRQKLFDSATPGIHH
jgi:hypothetical protein